MVRNNVIILIKDGVHEVWGSLKQICDVKKLSYHTLSRKKFPFKSNGISFVKVFFREENGIQKNIK